MLPMPLVATECMLGYVNANVCETWTVLLDRVRIARPAACVVRPILR